MQDLGFGFYNLVIVGILERCVGGGHGNAREDIVLYNGTELILSRLLWRYLSVFLEHVEQGCGMCVSHKGELVSSVNTTPTECD